MSHRKKVAWLTPFGPASSVGEFSRSVLEAAAKDDKISAEYEFTVFVNDNGDRYTSSWPVVGLRALGDNFLELAITLRAGFDYLVFNYGNNVENHGDIFQIANHCDGIVILHDVVYQHYLAGMIFDKFRSPSHYAYAMGKYHGVPGLETTRASGIMSLAPIFAPWDTAMAGGFPLTKCVLDNSNIKGVVVHSEYALAAADFPADRATRLRLPGDEKKRIPILDIKNWLSKQSSEKTTICSIGHIQRSKLIHEIILSLFKLREEFDFRFIVAGRPSDKSYLDYIMRLVDELNMENYVQFETDVSEDRLAELKTASDLFINLRIPNTEGGSGSLIEQMAAGKPVVVLNSGSFAEVNQGVLKISDICELEGCLRSVLSNPSLQRAIGKEALEYANSYLCIDYARDLLNFVSRLAPVEVSQKRLKGMHLSNLLSLDPYLMNTSTIESWGKEAFVTFMLSLPEFNEDDRAAFEYLCRLREDAMQTARAILLLVRSALRIFLARKEDEDLKRYKLPEVFPCEYYIFSIYASKDTFDRLIKTSVGISHFTEIDNIRNKVEHRLFGDNLHLNVSALIEIWNNLSLQPYFPNHLQDDLGRSIAEFSTLIQLTQRTREMPEREFGEFSLKSLRNFLCVDDYFSRYADVRDSHFGKTLAGACEHFQRFGLDEGRNMRLDVEKIVQLKQFPA